MKENKLLKQNIFTKNITKGRLFVCFILLIFIILSTGGIFFFVNYLSSPVSSQPKIPQTPPPHSPEKEPIIVVPHYPKSKPPYDDDIDHVIDKDGGNLFDDVVDPIAPKFFSFRHGKLVETTGANTFFINLMPAQIRLQIAKTRANDKDFVHYGLGTPMVISPDDNYEIFGDNFISPVVFETMTFMFGSIIIKEIRLSFKQFNEAVSIRARMRELENNSAIKRLERRIKDAEAALSSNLDRRIVINEEIITVNSAITDAFSHSPVNARQLTVLQNRLQSLNEELAEIGNNINVYKNIINTLDESISNVQLNIHNGIIEYNILKERLKQLLTKIEYYKQRINNFLMYLDEGIANIMYNQGISGGHYFISKQNIIKIIISMKAFIDKMRILFNIYFMNSRNSSTLLFSGTTLAGAILDNNMFTKIVGDKRRNRFL